MGTGASGLRLQGLGSAPNRHGELIEQAEERGRPAVPRQEPEDDPSTRLHDLRRDGHQDATECRELKPQERRRLFATGVGIPPLGGQ
ncbi:MAG: hypothetical protein NTW75_18010 [Planctomycetales bacterium]|nr:hypothetical protein [Planctomycetales bacterium]